MEGLKRARRPIRWEFEKLHRELEKMTKVETPSSEVQTALKVKFKLLSDTFDQLRNHDAKIMEQMLADAVPVEEENKEYEEMLEYKSKFEMLKLVVEITSPTEKPPYAESLAGSENTTVRVRNFKLPTIEMKKFSGKLEDWLAWWAQFEKIDEDPHMNGSDKFWYLLQSLQPGNDAHEMVVGYPQSNENYPKVVAALRKRFGNQDLLLQVYIRQLLQLVISNVNAKEKIPVKSLYLKLDSHLRALKTLELQKADQATWLFPLVESSLPEKILDNWQRSPLSSHDGSKDVPPRTRLDLLMEFLEKEVDIKQRIDITRTFANDYCNDKRHDQQQQQMKIPPRRIEKRPLPIPTLTSFHSAEKRSCAFCGMSNHDSKSCMKAKNMTYEEKMEVLRKNRLCYRCCGNHLSNNCHAANVKCHICDRNHYPILCKEFKQKRGNFSNRENPAKRVRLDPPREQHTSHQHATFSGANIGSLGKVALKTLLVKLCSAGKEEIVRAFIDEGCERSYILKSTAQKLNLKSVGVTSAIHLLWGGNRTTEIHHKQYEVKLKPTRGHFEIDVLLREQEPICGRLHSIVSKYPQIKKVLQMENIKLADAEFGEREIELLIGADVYPHLLTGEFKRLESGPFAIRTKLGWTLMGEINEKERSRETHSALTISMGNREHHVSSFWDLEMMGIKEAAGEEAIKKKAELAKEEYAKNISRDAVGRYVVKLPWKDDIPHLPDNKFVALKRLQSATNKLLQNDLFEKYDQIFREWEQEGFIEKVVQSTNSQQQLHYLPHRPVIKPESLTTPVRPVFDASCRAAKSPSLNDCLFTGENYILKIPEILHRFREKRVGFVADIRKAFQMIGVHPADRDALRFLWWSDKSLKTTVEYRHARVVFGVTCSPFILAVVLLHHLTNLPADNLEMGKKLLSTLYVDNCASSEDSVKEYHHFRKKAIELMTTASMDLRMWLDNVENLNDVETRVVSVLGLMWDRREDALYVNTKGFSIPEKITKRAILSSVQKVFDPVGFTSPCVLPLKIMLQQLWQQKVKWDQQLPEEVENKFLKWCKEAAEMSEMKIPRCFSSGVSDRRNWSVFVFTDASKLAFSGVVFLRVKGEDSGVTVQLVAAKSRVTPVKKMTIPKLELMSCLFGVRLYQTVKNALSLEGVPVSFYSDSTTALAWIKRDDQWGTFVANRVKEIRLHTTADNWIHVPGSHNPADLPSRGCFPAQLMSSKWWEGPTWLYTEESEWPRFVEAVDETEIAAERKKSATAEVVTSFSVMEAVKNAHSFASLVRIVGWVRRFLWNKLVKDDSQKRRGHLTKSEMEKAEIIFVRDIQREAFPPGKRDQLRGLEVFEDDWGVLRIKTRLTYREDLGNFRYPMLLPHNDERVRRLIVDYHRIHCHAGVGFLMTALRKKYWIVKCRKTIRGVLNKCERCRRFSAKPIIPAAAPLPLDRVKDAEVFEVVGVDLAGPLILRNGSKVWMVIFTCAVYRAVHFELVKKLTTAAFIRALEVFCEKFRRPAIIYSDNGTNFKGAFNLFKGIDWSSLARDEKTKQIEWKFNPVTSSWWGGWFERLIGSAKQLMRRTVGKGCLSWEELRAVVKTVAEVMNNRPLTYVSENVEDLEPLTPALFLHPFGNATLLEREMTEAEKLRFRLKYVNKLREELKGRFLREYLSMLVNRYPKKLTRELKEGELVLVGSDNVKRVEWPLGRVVGNIPGRDGVCRLAKVKTEKGEIVRSVQRLFPLEADSEVESVMRVREKGVVTRSVARLRRLSSM